MYEHVTWSDWGLSKIRVQPPIVLARDRTHGRDAQRVGWRVVVRLFEGYYPDYSIKTVLRTTVRTARAWDDRPAAFEARTIDVSRFRGFSIWVRVQMVWYRAGDPSVIEGRAMQRVWWYALEGGLPWRGSCPSYVT
jgi:hypothetical protein